MDKTQNNHLVSKPYDNIPPQWHDDQNLNDDIRYEIVEDIFNMITAAYDQTTSPHTAVLNFLLEYYFKTKSEKAKEIITKTLDTISKCKVFDQENPHYKKTLEDHALLIDIYIKAYQVFQEKPFKDTALEIIQYITNNLVAEKKDVFYASQTITNEHHQLPLEGLPKPTLSSIDKTIHTDWNAMAISAFLKAYQVFRDETCLKTAIKTIHFLLNHYYDSEKGMLHYYDETSYRTGQLKDQIYMINALIDAYETTGEKNYLEQAVEIGEMVYDMFYDKDHGGFIESLPYPDNHQDQVEIHKSIENNGFAAQVFLRLYSITEEWVFYDIIQTNLTSFVSEYKQAGYTAAAYGTGINHLLHNANHITLVGDDDDDKLYELLYECHKFYIPRKAIKILDYQIDRDRIKDLGYEPTPSPRAYIIIENHRFPPIQNPSIIHSTLLRLQYGGKINASIPFN